MRVALLYVCVTHGRDSVTLAGRFASTYRRHGPGCDHDTIIVCNGGPLATELALIFSNLRPQYWPRRNDPGWDISAYIEAAHTLCASYDMVMCCGASAYFHRAGWLQRFVEAWQKHGPGFYGTFSSFLIRPHLQTNGFCCPPALLREWKEPVTSREKRYEFEHGQTALWHRAAIACLVTWDGEWGVRQWRKPDNILWRGDQSNCLLWNNHSDRWFAADHETRLRWSANADR